MRPQTIRTSVDLPKDLHRRLHEAALRKGCSARQLILQGIEQMVGNAPRRRRVDLRQPLVKLPGPPINLTSERMYAFIEHP